MLTAHCKLPTAYCELPTAPRSLYLYTMAGGKVRKIFRSIFLTINCILAFLFLLACLVPYLNPSRWWFMGLFGLAFPYLALLLLLFIIFWLIVKSKWALVPLFVLLIGWKQLSVLFAMHRYETFMPKKDSTYLRILDWNIRSFEGISGKVDRKSADRSAIPETVIAQNADVVCLQEFNSSSRRDNIAPFISRYPYHYFSRDFELSRYNYHGGTIIFSRYPIVDSGRIPYPDSLSGSIIYADIQTPRKIIRVFTTHLQSFRFSKLEYEGIEKIKSTEEADINSSKSILQKMKLSYTKKGTQADITSEALRLSRYPSIICGDFNDVPNSYTYFKIRGDRQDAFLATSLGIGRTYLAIAPTLRIDYILPDNNFVIDQFDLVDEDLSDHLMLVADLMIK